MRVQVPEPFESADQAEAPLRVMLTEPVDRGAKVVVVVFELRHFPYLLLWENFAARGGWPFWGDADTFALEWSSNPGRTVSDAVEAGAVRTLDPKGVLDTEMRVAWEPLMAPADAPAAS